ncbi:MAG: PP2C family protein-serine/threonine phosphatase [Bacteroidota bacterium]|jgi:hypothetical protein
MKSQKTFNKPLPSFVFYLGSAVSFFFAILTLTAGGDSSVPKGITTLPVLLFPIYLALGFLLLLEPLHRLGKLPARLEQWYKTTSFADLAGKFRRWILLADVVFLTMASVIVTYFAINEYAGKGVPGFLLFTIFVCVVLSIGYLVLFIVQRRHPELIGFVVFSPFSQFVSVVSPSSMGLGRRAISLGGFVVPVACSFVLAGQMPSGHYLGPVLLAIILCSTFGSFLLIGIETAEKAKIQSELETAHDMQMSLMPTADPVVEGFDISGICRPAEEVGGDFFDYVWLNEEKTRLGIAIADVSGKAMKAAITAVMTSGMVYREIGSNDTPRTILRKINKPIYLKTDKRIFTAMSFAVIDTTTKLLTFSNAGQMDPILKRGEEVQCLKVGGARLPLGVREEVEYAEMSIQLRGGDTVIFYTDGISEAMNRNKEMFGFERLQDIVKRLTVDSSQLVKESFLKEVDRFSGATKQHDDMTVVVVQVKR